MWELMAEHEHSLDWTEQNGSESQQSASRNLVDSLPGRVDADIAAQ